MRRLRLLSFIAIACVTGPLTASAQTPAEELTGAISPFLDEQTIAIAHLALEDVEVPAAVGELLTAAAVSDEEGRMAADVAQAAQGWLEQVRAAGAEHLFVVFSIADFPQGGPFVVVSFGDKGDRDEIVRLLGGRDTRSPVRTGPFPVIESFAGAVIAGQPSTVERLRQRVRRGNRDAPPEHLMAAFQEAADAPARLVFIPSEEHRRVIREMLPVLDWPLEGLSGEMIADGFVWAAIGFDPAEPSVRAVVQSQNEVAAARLAQGIDLGLDLLASFEEARQVVDDPQKVVAILRPELAGDRVIWNVDARGGRISTFVQQVLSPPLRAARAAAQRSERMNRFRPMGIAMHNHHDVYKSFPPQAIRDEQGRPLLSWRVALLPFLDGGALYEQFHLNEPWDSPHNIRLVERMPSVFADPALPQLAAEGKTTFQVPVHEETIFPPGGDGIPFKEIKDGTSNTIMLVEVVPGQAVPWTKPDDWEVEKADPLAGVRRKDRETFTALRADASVHTIANDFDPELWWKFLTRAGAEPTN